MLLATSFSVGYAPFAPGTFGSAVGLVVFLLLAHQGPAAMVAAIVSIFAIGVWSGTIAERELGGTDPGPVVIDEVVGMLITLAFIPVNISGALVGFFVFRALDVVKPWPARRFESLHGGLGIMADDAMAAVYGNLIMRGLLAIVPAGWLA
jgi:phosphatidylglycerophosphatase A